MERWGVELKQAVRKEGRKGGKRAKLPPFVTTTVEERCCEHDDSNQTHRYRSREYYTMTTMSGRGFLLACLLA